MIGRQAAPETGVALVCFVLCIEVEADGPPCSTALECRPMLPLRMTFAISALALAAVAAACDSDPTGPPMVTRLECEQPDGQFLACDLVLQEAAGFAVKLESTSCEAHGNTLRITKPVQETLLTDGCHTEPSTEWTYLGPYPAGTAIALEIESARLRNPPSLRVSGEFPQWTVSFEDGWDTDYDDLVLTVRTLE